MDDLAAQARRFTYQTATRLAGRAAGAVLTVVALHEATRYFGTGRWGQIAAAIAWVSIFVSLGPPGVTTYAMREVGRNLDDRDAVLVTGVSAALLLSVLGAVFAAAIGAGLYAGSPHILRLVLLVAVWVPFMALFLLGGGLLAVIGRSDLRAVLDVFSSLLLLGATLAVVHAGLSDSAYVLLYAGTVGASAAAAFGLLFWRMRPRLRSGRVAMSRFLKAAFPLGQVDTFSAVYGRADSLMLYFIRGRAAIGVYAVAYQIATFVMVMPGFLTGALVGDFMRSGAARQRELGSRAIGIGIATAVPLPFFFGIFSPPFIAWLSGPQFAEAAPVLTILSVAASLALLNGLLFQLTVYMGHEERLWQIVGAVTVANLVANGVAIPLFGAKGAAIALIVSEMVGLFLYWPRFKRAASYKLDLALAVSTLAAALLVFGTWLGLHLGLGVGAGRGAAVIPRALAVVAAYLTLLWLLRVAWRRRNSATLAV